MFDHIQKHKNDIKGRIVNTYKDQVEANNPQEIEKSEEAEKGRKFVGDYGGGKNRSFRNSKGEGSKGGVVVGHTTSGKPIYRNFNHASHKNFTKKDHEDAADIHSSAAFKTKDHDDKKKHHRQQANEHATYAKHYDKVNKKEDKKKGDDHPLKEALDKFTKKYTDKPKHWGEGSAELAEVHSAMAEHYNDQDDSNKDKYTGHHGYTKGSAADAHARHKKGIDHLYGKLNKTSKDSIHERYSEWFGKKTEKSEESVVLNDLPFQTEDIRKSRILDIYGSKSEVEEFVKSGEGSKGGKVIGHTKSGKAIYDSADHSSHKNFTSADHLDAHDLHQKKAKVHEKNAVRAGNNTAVKNKEHSLSQAKEHEKLANPKSEVGGNKIGKTKSGKDVYRRAKTDASEYKNFTAQDHKDAADLHHDLYDKRVRENVKNKFKDKDDEMDHHEKARDAHYKLAEAGGAGNKGSYNTGSKKESIKFSQYRTHLLNHAAKKGDKDLADYAKKANVKDLKKRWLSDNDIEKGEEDNLNDAFEALGL